MSDRTRTQAAEIAGVSERTIGRHIAEGSIKGEMVHGVWLLDRASFEAWRRRLCPIAAGKGAAVAAPAPGHGSGSVDHQVHAKTTASNAAASDAELAANRQNQRRSRARENRIGCSAKRRNARWRGIWAGNCSRV